jgi:hypothetical protein
VQQFVGLHMRPVPVLLAVSVFAEEPQRRMRPEEREGPSQEADHELGGQPGVGIAAEIVGRGMRLERKEARRRLGMTGLAGLQTIVGMHVRGRIAHPLNGMAAVAVEALGRMGIAQCVHLPVIGVGV